ncbi:hypothetical protein [Streptomyces bohaiensis]|uniref:hypothetical protein n=1 Tax=Streptomyces bohaiensis TaxID=1431344 RepID=UPI003B7D5FCC
MSNVGAEAELVQQFTSRGIRNDQQVLLGGVLRALDPRGLLTQHAASPSTMSIALSRAHAVLSSRAASDQPYGPLAHKVLGDAKDAVSAACAFGAVGQRLVEVKAFLDAVCNGGPSALKNRGQCSDWVKGLAKHRIAVSGIIADLTASAWDRPQSDIYLAWLAAETAALCLVRERTYDVLMNDVHTLLRRPGKISGDELVDVLFPAPKPFRVVIAVEGAAELAIADSLMSEEADCRQFAIDALPEKWPYGRAELASLAEVVERRLERRQRWAGGSPKALLLAFRVCAGDSGAAMLRGRREAAELLDQYVAGHRLADLRLGEESLVCAEGSGRTNRFAGTPSAPVVARPLTGYWPTQLREGMRMAHIARTTEGLTASTSLNAATLEAIGLKVDSPALAQALSLQALRQQVTSTYQELRVAALGGRRAAANALESARRQRVKIENDLERAVVKKGMAPPQLKAARDDALQAVEDRTREDAEAEVCFRRPLEVLDSWTGANSWGRVTDINRWLDVLAPHQTAAAGLDDAVTALGDLTGAVGGRAAHVVCTWQRRLTGLEVKDWIEQVEKRFSVTLRWLKVTRNTVLHEGSFDSETGLLDAQSARALVDLTLEFLGNWYQHSEAAASASDVVGHLARRQKEVLAEIERSGTRSLNLTRLTSPNSSGVDRN